MRIPADISVVYRLYRPAILLLLICGRLVHCESGFCPNMCVCKWKSGKQSVECTDKGLITIPEDIDPETQLLDMSGNNLQVLPNKTFVRAALLNLQRIYLKNCHIGQIDDEALDGLSNVVDLDLSMNLLTSVPTSIFRDVPNLRDLSLARNPIQKIDSRAFRFISGLVRLDLSRCKLESIAADAFSDVNTLESLKLNGNNLRDLKPKTIEVLNGLHGVDLHDNPWYCDCNLRPVKIWLTAKNIPHPVHPVCSGGPTRVLNVSFKELTTDDFACKPEIKLKQEARYVEGVIGENTTVTCRVESVPEAKITWYWNGRQVINNTAPFGHYQRVLIVENGQMDKRSSLIVINAQETDSGSLHCVAENPAGSSGANFTLRITHRIATFAMFTNGQMAGLSVALICLIFSILVVIVYLLLRIKKIPSPVRYDDVKTTPRNNVVEDAVAATATANGNVCRSLSNEKQLSSSVSPTRDVITPTNLVGISGVVDSSYNGLNRDQQHHHHHFHHRQQYNFNNGGNNLCSSSYYAAEYVDRSPRALAIGTDGKNSSNPDLIANTTSTSASSSNSSSSTARLTKHPNSLLWSSDNRRSPDRYLDDFETVDSNDRTPIIDDVPPPESTIEYVTLPRYGISGNGISNHCRYAAGIENKVSSSSSSSEAMANTTASSAVSSSTNSSNGGYPNAKTLRVWQKGVQVLPPVSTLKRVLSRNSPDEGYQEGCGTDV